jgi:hypothetical protein
LAGMVKSVAAEMHTATRGQLGVPPPVVVNAQGAITCPQCGSAMTQRVARHGPTAGSAFWGCSRFPTCRGTRPIGASHSSLTQ